MIPRAFSEKIQKQQFTPGILGIFINPFYIARHTLLKTLHPLAPRLTGKMLDVGCGQKPYEHLFVNASSYTGIEFDTPHARKYSKADAFYNGSHFPFPDEQFDSVLATEVLEHVFSPDEWLTEIRRVLKSGGTLLLTAPFLWSEHEQPRDYVRYTSFGLKQLLEKHGFSIHAHMQTANDTSCLFQLFNTYLYKKIPAKSYHARLVFYILLMAPMTLLGILFGKILPKNDDLYLDNVVLARKV